MSIDDADAPDAAAEVIRAGGLVIVPTDTVYGVAAALDHPEAVARLYEIKRRPPEKAIAILLSDFRGVRKVAQHVPPQAQKLADAFWPGALTLALPKWPIIPDIVSSLPTVGVRIPDHEALRAVIRACGGALPVTSANISGEPSPLNAEDAARLGDEIDLVLDGGQSPGNLSSTVVDLSEGNLRILREGPIDEASLRRVLGL